MLHTYLNSHILLTQSDISSFLNRNIEGTIYSQIYEKNFKEICWCINSVLPAGIISFTLSSVTSLSLINQHLSEEKCNRVSIFYCL